MKAGRIQTPLCDDRHIDSIKRLVAMFRKQVDHKAGCHVLCCLKGSSGWPNSMAPHLSLSPIKCAAHAGLSWESGNWLALSTAEKNVEKKTFRRPQTLSAQNDNIVTAIAHARRLAISNVCHLRGMSGCFICFFFFFCTTSRGTVAWANCSQAFAYDYLQRISYQHSVSHSAAGWN